MSEPFISANTNKRSDDGLLPQSLEAEQALLGAVLADSECLTRVFEFIPKSEFFYKKAHQLIFHAFYELSEKNDNIDVITTSQHLKDKGLLEDVGGRSYLSALTDHAPIAANAEYYAKIVKSKYLLRSLISTGNEIVSLGYQSEEELDKLLDKAEQMVFGLTQSQIKDNLTHIGEIVQASWEILEQREANKGALLGVDTGFYDMNAITAGLQKSDLIILAARPAMGKCLQKDSEIVLGDGSIATIEEIYKKREANLLTLNPNWKLSLTQASDFIDDGIKPIFKVTTRLGREVKTTITHPYLTISGWKKLEEIKVGDKIAVPRKIDVFGAAKIEESKIQSIAENVLQNSEFEIEQKTFLQQEVVSTQKIANASHQSLFSINNATNHYTESLSPSAIPNIIFTLEKNQLSLFLDKIFEQSKSVFRSANKKLVRELQHLLLRFGIIAAIRKEKTSWKLKIEDKSPNTNSQVSARGDVYWDEITSIEYLGEDQVYDLTILDTHNFVANDICVHNTSLALNIGENVAIKNKKPVAVFSLEMSKEQLVQRLLCSHAQVDSNRIRTGQLYPEDWTRLGEAMSELGEAPLYIDDSPGLSVMELRGKCRRLMAEQGDLGLVIVDYIQLMDGKNNDSRINQISEISRGLKMLARELNVPIVALSQLSRAVEARQDKRPMLSDLRESGCLTANTLIFRPDLAKYVTLDSLLDKKNFSVLALDENQKLVEAKASHAFCSGEKEVFEVTTTSGHVVKASANHPFLTAEGWKPLEEIQEGTLVATARTLKQSPAEAKNISESDIFWDKIKSIKSLGVQKVYDITVPEYHNFVAENFILHNSLEQDSDIVMFVYRDEYYNPESEKKGMAEVIVAKQRSGPVGTLELLFQSNITKFRNPVKESS